MHAYTERSTASQEFIDTVDIAEIARELCPAQEVRDFIDAIPEPPSVTEARWRIIETYESGAIGAVEAFYALEAHGCLADADDFFQSFIAGARFRLNLGEMPSVEPDVAPGVPELVRVTSHVPQAVQALAEARMGRDAA